MTPLLLLLLLSLAAISQGHMTIYVPSMWGSEPGNDDSDWAAQPLQDYDLVDWVCCA